MDDILRAFQVADWKPHQYQQRGISWLSERVAAALFFAPGLGKTSTTLAAILRLKQLGLSARTLVVAPKPVCITVWMTEFKKWGQFSHLKVGFAHGPFREEIARNPMYDIVVTNYDSFPWLVPILQAGHTFDIFVSDELSKFKHTNSKRFKLFKPVLHTFRQRWGLTGTPASNGLMDLFGEIYVLDLGMSLGRYVTKFRLEYFYQKPFDIYRWYPIPQKQAKLLAAVQQVAMFVDPQEELDLPDFIPVTKTVQLPPTVRDGYLKLEKEFLLHVEDGTVTAANAGVLTSKLRQYTGGAIYYAMSQWSHVHDEKVEAVVELVEELGGSPLIIAYLFDHERERLLKHFPNALVLKGAMTDNAIRNVIDDWNTGAHPIMLVQPASGKYGLNLQSGGNKVAWFTMTYDLEEFIQMNARIYRQGQVKDKVLCYMFVTENTIDEWVAKVLREKDATQEGVFAALLEGGTQQVKQT
jgi:SNF2 family DNA or RNA helicase